MYYIFQLQEILHPKHYADTSHFARLHPPGPGVAPADARRRSQKERHLAEKYKAQKKNSEENLYKKYAWIYMSLHVNKAKYFLSPAQREKCTSNYKEIITYGSISYHTYELIVVFYFYFLLLMSCMHQLNKIVHIIHGPALHAAIHVQCIP